MNIRHGRTAVWVIVAALVASGLSGCGQPRDSPSKDDTRSTDDGPTTVDATTANACDLVSTEDIDPINTGHAKPASVLLFDLTYDGCVVGSVRFGVRLLEGDFDPKRLVSRSETAEAVPLSGVGDEAYRIDSENAGEVYETMTIADFGSYEVIVQNSSLGGSDEALHVSDEAIVNFISVLGESIPENYRDIALMAYLREGCPAEDSASMAPLLPAEVTLARGGYVGTEVQCTYRDEAGSSVQLRRYFAADAAQEIRSLSEYGEPIEIDGAVAATLTLSSISASVVVQPTDSEIVLINVDLVDGELSQAEVMALTQDFLVASSDPTSERTNPSLG